MAAFAGTVESQGRETLHLHCIVWIAHSLNPQEIKDRIVSGETLFRDAMIMWLESCHQGHLSRGSVHEWEQIVKAKKCSPAGYDDPTNKLPERPPHCNTPEELERWLATLLEISDELLYLCNQHSSNHTYGCRRPPDFNCHAWFP